MPRFVFKLPDIGEGTAEAEIAAWRVKVGDVIEEDAPLVDMMTDKATVELTSPVSGTVVEVAGEAGAMVPVGSALVVIETSAFADIGATPEPQGDGPAMVEADAGVHEAAHPSPSLRPAAHLPPPGGRRVDPATTSALPQAGGGTAAQPQGEGTATAEQAPAPLAAPAVRARAKALGIDLAQLPPGPHGRIRHADLDRMLATTLPPPGGGTAPKPQGEGTALAERHETQTLKIIGLRRKIAEKMQEAKRRIPHFAYVEEVDVTELEALRQHLNATTAKERGKLTLLPLLIRALTRTLPHFPQVNARFDDDAGEVHRHAAVHLGLATQTPNGLIVPVIRNAEARSLWDLAAEITRLSTAAKAGKAAAKELSGSTITITSLGALGGIVTTPVINHPEVAIVGVNKMVERPMVHHGQIAIRRMMNLSSSFDHRVVDGYDAAAFIQSVKAMLEHPATLFIDE